MPSRIHGKMPVISKLNSSKKEFQSFPNANKIEFDANSEKSELFERKLYAVKYSLTAF